MLQWRSVVIIPINFIEQGILFFFKLPISVKIKEETPLWKQTHFEKQQESTGAFPHNYLKYFLYCQRSAYNKEAQKWFLQKTWLENTEDYLKKCRRRKGIIDIFLVNGSLMKNTIKI